MLDIGSGVCGGVPGVMHSGVTYALRIGIGQVALEAAAMGYFAVGVEKDAHRHESALVCVAPCVDLHHSQSCFSPHRYTEPATCVSSRGSMVCGSPCGGASLLQLHAHSGLVFICCIASAHGMSQVALLQGDFLKMPGMEQLVASADLVWCNNLKFDDINAPLQQLISAYVKPKCAVATTLELFLGDEMCLRNRKRNRKSGLFSFCCRCNT